MVGLSQTTRDDDTSQAAAGNDVVEALGRDGGAISRGSALVRDRECECGEEWELRQLEQHCCGSVWRNADEEEGTELDACLI